MNVYTSLMNHYGWTPEQIANMTPHQQVVALCGIQSEQNPFTKNVKFNNQKDYERWLANKLKG